MKQTALITGANGFLGSHLTKRLKSREISPISVPRGLLFNLDNLRSFIHQYNPQYIYHFAAYGNHSMQHDENITVMSNYFATWNLLQASKYIDYHAFVNVSTSSVYGKKYETMKPADVLEPNTFYSATKAGIEYLAMAYKFEYKKPIITVRPFSVYGPGEADWRFIPSVCRAIAKQEAIPVVRWPQHDWIYIDDFINGILVAADHPRMSEPINIGTGIATTNDEIIKTLSYTADKGVKAIEDAYKEMAHHSAVWKADNTTLKGLGWKQEVLLGEGLKRCWEYYSKKYSEAKDNENPGII